MTDDNKCPECGARTSNTGQFATEYTCGSMLCDDPWPTRKSFTQSDECKLAEL